MLRNLQSTLKLQLASIGRGSVRFRSGSHACSSELGLEEEEERELRTEERRKGVELRMGDMVGSLARYEKRVARVS